MTGNTNLTRGNYEELPAFKLVRVFINKMILIFPVCALDSGFKPRQLLA